MQLALEASGMGTWSWDTATGRVEWDAGHRGHLRPRARHVPRHVRGVPERLHPDDRESAVRRIDRSLDGGGDASDPAPDDPRRTAPCGGSRAGVAS